MGLDISLLGGFQIIQDGLPVTALNQPRQQSLLAYLLLHTNSQVSRRYVAGLFWPEQSEAQARNNLRQLLHQIRHTLPISNQFLHADANSLEWRADPSVRLDVWRFDQSLQRFEAASKHGNLPTQSQALEEAIELYRGDLLPSCYEDWIIPEREELQQRYLKALERQILLLEAQREYSSAIAAAQRLLQQDPLYEHGYRLLIRLYAQNDDRASALRAYQVCVETLARELGVEPEPATRDIYQRLVQFAAPPPSQAPAASEPTIPLIGRDAAWSRLLSAWQRAIAGEPGFVLIRGEAGIGKSRLAEDFMRWATRQGFAAAKTRAYAGEGNLAYSPLADWLRSVALQPALKRLEPVWLTEISRLLPELAAEHPGLPAPDPLKEHWQRTNFFQALNRVIFAARTPLLLCIDDLHWCDAETLEWLHYLLRGDPHARILVVGAARTEEMDSIQAFQTLLSNLQREERIVEIHLSPLDAAETAHLAQHAVGSKLDTAQALRLFRETEGNPLFILEMMRSGFLDNPGNLEAASPGEEGFSEWKKGAKELPARVKSVIAARLARLSPPAQELTWLSATFGRAFSFPLLLQASGADAADLVRWLDELWQGHILREVAENIYDFTHDKLREVAYTQISPPRRRYLHQRVATALVLTYAGDPDPVSGQIAAHYEQAGQIQQAIPFYHRAGLVAQRVGAIGEAIGWLQAGLGLLKTLPETPERDAQELDLLLALGVSVVDDCGHGSPDVLKVYYRAEALNEKLAQPPNPPILRALAIANIAGARFRPALEYGEQLLRLAENRADPVLAVEAHYSLGVAQSWLGAFTSAKGHLETALEQYQTKDSHLHINRYSQDPKVVCLSRVAFLYWCLGFPGRALAASREALTYAQELGHPFSLGYALFWNGLLQGHLRAFRTVLEHMDALLTLCQEQQISYWLPNARTLRGWAQAEQGEVEPGVSSIQEGMDAFWETGARFQHPFFLSLLAEQMSKVGHIDQAFALFAQAHAEIDKTEERWCEAELFRREGELFWQQGNQTESEKAFHLAIEIAQQQEARMIELRAVLSLARVWRQVGKMEEGRIRIAAIYSAFSEGFDFHDLKDARIFLESEPT